ncbi:MAG: putative tRNA pseudouridine synthase D [Candidatus Methanofastidiosum methylothiophilum]|uniref:Probable tRNA pseudouridine synthase D n=1 Tax=Candidatus Methanofastidiosum methylothiophilum TaxID=1705564 RepID=A0A150IT78_9EURY|nr:MAG: putative tRNA pseudouridine synthase D [Candidatus Methanofastidiosum methylthiophilus]KYC48132.1 MAG: putative tRNA pseudouridine synthase D [Candidatus Methanofastidiosum methylthiophilus]KYC50629.1 MAG: putative tRNA pseudouridine synthase D [Candidatus Methanofastidiosum methylthiophilus]
MEIKKYPEDFQVEEVLDIKKGKYTVFKVKKINRDTIDVIHELARKTGIPFGKFGYAGLKDRHAVTIQSFSVDRIFQDNIKSLELKDVELYDFSEGQKLDIGDLIGNNFNILVRDLHQNSEQTIRSNIHEIEKYSGFPNLFGEQRFGGNEEVGLNLLKGDFKAAVEKLLLKDNLDKELADLIKDGKYGQALETYPKLRNERQILEYLSKSSEYSKSFVVLPPSTSSLFVHAYQAKIFNEAVVERIKEVPLNEVEIGDLVSMEKGGNYYRTQVNKANIIRVKEGINTGSINVIAPLIGYSSLVPKSLLGKISVELLEKDGITKESFRVREAPFLGSNGAYRNILGRYKDLSYKIEEEGVRFKFFLYKGEYATVFLKYLTSSLS